MKIQLLLIISLLSLAQIGLSQEVTISEAVTLRSDQSYSIIGKFNEKTLLYQDKGAEFEIQAFDNKLLGLSWTKELELDKKRPEVLDVLGKGDYFYVIYKFKQKGNSIIKIHKYNEAANLVDSTNIVNYGKRFYSPAPEIILSQDKKKLLLYHTEYFTQIEVSVFDLDKMEVLWKKEFTPHDLKFGADFYQMLVDNEGGMHMVLNRENDRFKKDKPHYWEFIYQPVDAEKSLTNSVFLEGNLSFDAYFKIDNLNKSIIGGGMYSEKNKGRTQGYYLLNMSYLNPEKKSLAFRAFDKGFKEQLVDKKVKTEKGLFDVGVQDIVIRRDGGAVIICEQLKDFERASAATNTTTTARGYYSSRENGRYAVDHYYEDLFLFSIHPDGAHHWQEILHKKQFSQDDDAAFSSFFLAKTPRDLRLIYNDEIRNENTVSEYVIKGNGEFDRNSILNTASQELRLRFRESQQVSINEILVPSERKGKLKLVRMLF